MLLIEATKLAVEIVSKLIPVCDKVEVAGSIRRGKGEVRDIDIVAIPNEDKLLAGGFFCRQHLISTLAFPAVPRANGTKLATFLYKGEPLYKGAQFDAAVDIYWATAETWGTILLIRTGSKEYNVCLCIQARSRGWVLHAGGEGLYDGMDRKIAGETEEGIFKALGMRFVPPGEREVRYPAAFRRTTPQAKENLLDITT